MTTKISTKSYPTNDISVKIGQWIEVGQVYFSYGELSFREATINWSSIGSSDATKTKQFLLEMNLAVAIADLLNERIGQLVNDTNNNDVYTAKIMQLNG